MLSLAPPPCYKRRSKKRNIEGQAVTEPPRTKDAQESASRVSARILAVVPPLPPEAPAPSTWRESDSTPVDLRRPY